MKTAIKDVMGGFWRLIRRPMKAGKVVKPGMKVAVDIGKPGDALF